MIPHDSSPRQLPGWVLLRDGHAVPLTGISPAEIKVGAKHRVPHPDAEPIKHRQTLTAIVGRLGFQGDWGDYQNTHWSQFETFLHEHNCTHRSGLFPTDNSGCYDLFFTGVQGPKRRQLADRYFESPLAKPERVFLGHGVDWDAWDQVRFVGQSKALADVSYAHGPAEEHVKRLFAGIGAPRFDLIGQWGFLDDKLVHGPVEHVVDKTYWPPGFDEGERANNLKKVTSAVRSFRAVFDSTNQGWVDILPYNERLVVLRGHDGAWEVLWRCYRDEEPPEPSDVGRWHALAIEDLPSRLMSESDLQRSVHFRQEVWEEDEAHAAEQAFYDRGGSKQKRRLTSEAQVRSDWLREQERLPAPERMRWEGTLPAGFHRVVVDGRELAMSDLIDLGSYRQMLVETGYASRRAEGGEPWERANSRAPDAAPVGASWVDAQAYCAWKERQLKVALRLPSREELRAIRPAYSEHYESLAHLDFPWENHPPRPLSSGRCKDPSGHHPGTPDWLRAIYFPLGQPTVAPNEQHESQQQVPSGIDWSEPRFLDPTPERPALPEPTGLSTSSRKRWIEDFPPLANWKEELPWCEHGGLRFIDAWDAYEWCQEQGWISGRFWEGPIGPTSWGAYKNVKTTFRVVLDLEG